jgi:glycosyltransferase involved in cell wall biosynthesis
MPMQCSIVHDGPDTVVCSGASALKRPARLPRLKILHSPQGIRYYGAADTSGYGQAALAYVRALVNAGVPVQWIPLDWAPERMQVGRWVQQNGSPRPLLAKRDATSYLADLQTLVQLTARPVAHDVVVAHAPPEFWPYAFESGKRNIGYAAWESDRSPAHWLPLLRQADRVIVPSTLNAEAFRRGGLQVPICVVAHIRRHRWCEFTPSDIAAAREDLGIPKGHRVLYTISAWDPRKAVSDLIRAYFLAFSAADPVTLLIKTGANGHATGPLYTRAPTRQLATQVITQIAAQIQRPAPAVLLHDEEVGGDAIDLIHAVGEVFVSLSHGEGWGLGAFEAAALGKPVVMTGWGGHRDYLGEDWPGAVPYRMVSVPLWPPDRPSYFPSQRWAEPDIAVAARMLRAVIDEPELPRAAALRIRERIVDKFAEPVVVTQLLLALS